MTHATKGPKEEYSSECANRRSPKISNSDQPRQEIIGGKQCTAMNAFWHRLGGVAGSSRLPAMATVLTGASVSVATAEAGESGHSSTIGPAKLAGPAASATVVAPRGGAPRSASKCAALLRAGRATADDLLLGERLAVHPVDRAGCEDEAENGDGMASARRRRCGQS